MSIFATVTKTTGQGASFVLLRRDETLREMAIGFEQTRRLGKTSECKPGETDRQDEQGQWHFIKLQTLVTE
jgi:hypothetical protein